MQTAGLSGNHQPLWNSAGSIAYQSKALAAAGASSCVRCHESAHDRAMAWAEGLTGATATTGRARFSRGDGWLHQEIPPLQKIKACWIMSIRIMQELRYFLLISIFNFWSLLNLIDGCRIHGGAICISDCTSFR